MKNLAQPWIKLSAVIVGTGLAAFALYSGISVLAQTAPVLGIAPAPSNQVLITVTNALSAGRYQIFFTNSLSPYPSWELWTNGNVGQSNFLISMNSNIVGVFRAASNTNFVPPSLNIIIQSPTNGALIY
jgi:hypothetical protein